MFVRFAALFVVGIFASAAACVAGEPVQIRDAKVVMVSPTLGAAYGTIAVAGKDTLISVSSDCCKAVEIHQSSMLNGVMSMRKISALEVSEKKPIVLMPHAMGTGASSMHLMLIGVNKTLTEADTVDMTLHFAHAGDVRQAFPVSFEHDHHH